MKYQVPKTFKPSEVDFQRAAFEVAKLLSPKVGIVTPKGKIIPGKRGK